MERREARGKEEVREGREKRAKQTRNKNRRKRELCEVENR